MVYIYICNFQYTSILEGTTASFFFLFFCEMLFFFVKVCKEVERGFGERRKKKEEEEESSFLLRYSYLLYLGKIKCF